VSPTEINRYGKKVKAEKIPPRKKQLKKADEMITQTFGKYFFSKHLEEEQARESVDFSQTANLDLTG
jgi:hypothetical protein